MRKSRGFTLIEVLVALVIVAGAIVAAATLWSGNFMRLRRSAVQYDVATLLERKMVEVEAKFSNKPINEIPESETGDFGSDYPQYTWSMESRDLELPDLTALLMSQKEEGTDEMLISMMKQMGEFLSNAIKEVRVTVHVKRKGKEFKYSATQYFMDWERDFAGAMGGAAGGAGTGTGGNP